MFSATQTACITNKKNCFLARNHSLKALKNFQINNKFSLILFALILIFNACGSKKTDLPEYQVISPGTLNFSNTWNGTGTIRLKNSLASNLGSYSFEIKTKLSNVGSMLKVYFFATENQQNGLKIQLEKNQTAHSLALFDSSSMQRFSIDSFVTESTDLIHLMIDLHQNETPLHALIWNAKSSIFSAQNALLDTLQNSLNLQAGQGNFVFIEFTDAELSLFKVGTPQDAG